MRVLLGCDGGGPLGVGHVMRSLALAEAAADAGHEVVVAGYIEGSFLPAQLAAAPVEVVPVPTRMGGGDEQPLVDLVRSLRPDVLHVDGYSATGRLRELVATAGDIVFSNMEDGTFGRRPADVVIDPTFGAELTARPLDGSTWLLRGSRYTPVRRRVIEARRPAIEDPGSQGPVGSARQGGRAVGNDVARSVLVVMGGTDPMGLAPAAVGLLARTGLALDVTAIAVGENAERAREVARGSGLSLNILAPVDNLAEMMSTHDLVISAAGTSVGELCCIGAPTAVAWVVDNQREGYERVVAAGAAIGLGGPDLGAAQPGGDERSVALLRQALTDPLVRERLAGSGRRVVDGLGAWRVVRTWEQVGRQLQRPDPAVSAERAVPAIPAGALVARPATLPDCRQLWTWRNDPATRAGSRSSAQVPWEDHLRWFNASLARTDRMLLLIEDPAGPVGTVRWDLRSEGEGDWEVSITVAPQRRGQSLARPLLRAAELALRENISGVCRPAGTDLRAYLAVVHTDNRSSMRLFETSAYVPDLPPDSQGFMQFRKAAQVT